jgi:hypothetical protein
VPLVKSVKSSLNSNQYWLGLMSELQNTLVPKDLTYLENIPESFQVKCSLGTLNISNLILVYNIGGYSLGRR